MELHKEKTKLEGLKAKADAAGEARVKAKKKAGALRKLKSAEESLVADMKNKLKGAKGDLASWLQQLHDEKMREAQAAHDAKTAKEDLGEWSGKLADAESALKKLDVGLKTVEGNIVVQRKVHLEISSAMKEASSISIPENTPVEEAKKILEDKEQKLRTLTSKLLAQIKQEKANIDKKHKMMINQKKIGDAIVADQNKVAEKSVAAQAADQIAANATASVKGGEAEVSSAKANVTKDEDAEKTAENNLEDVEKKDDEAEKKRAETKKEVKKLDGEAKKVEDKAENEAKKARDAASDIDTVANTPLPDINVTSVREAAVEALRALTAA